MTFDRSLPPFTITGIGRDEVALSYQKDNLEDAVFLAAKMTDNGVREACVTDASGDEIPWRKIFRASLRNRSGSGSYPG